ncbi:hypothetical protein V5799_023855 [Amblyomma americanum]|uniref:Uncharacterized protein n=1 Tax=Amblyomma americanum TaxID=6943 RepID=A0AAQ4FHV9_AMBAM
MQLDHNLRLEEYYKSGRMLVKLAESVGRVVLAGREMTRLAGFTARVSQLRHVLHDLARGHYVRSMLAVPAEVIYPDTHLDMLRKGVTDEQLARFLHLVQLDYVLERERGWDTIQDWMDILSGGEKQRIAVSCWHSSP